MSSTLDLSHYLADVQPISITRPRGQTLDVPLVPEKSQVAALIGELMWFQSQAGLAMSEDLSIVQGKVPDGTGHQFLELNKVLAQAKRCL